jgi:hypothetical protein
MYIEYYSTPSQMGLGKKVVWVIVDLGSNFLRLCLRVYSIRLER